MSNFFVQYWRDHGTKLLGGVVGLVGAAGESLALIQQFDPKRAALWAMVITLAAGIVKRGFGNTQQNAAKVAAAVASTQP